MADSDERFDGRTPEQFALNRAFYPTQTLLAPCRALHSHWQFSRDVLLRATKTLASAPLGESVNVVAVAGSLGRMEAAAHSDCDLIIVVDDDSDPDSEHVQHAMADIWQRLTRLGLRLPKSWGIFANATSGRALTQPRSLGDMNESRAVFGKRIQLLLDCQPIYSVRTANDDIAFDALQSRILDWYATAFLNVHQDKQWTYLLNDLIRYFRSYAAWHQFKTTVEHDDSWYIRNAKLRSSRLIMYAGLLFLLGESSHVGFDKPAWLHKRLKLTPLERVLYSLYCADNSGESATTLLRCYDACLALMARDEIRAALIAGAPSTVAALPPASIDAYEALAKETATLKTLLTQHTLSRTAAWHPRFVEYLIF